MLYINDIFRIRDIENVIIDITVNCIIAELIIVR